jgi:hypothetical protein
MRKGFLWASWAYPWPCSCPLAGSWRKDWQGHAPRHPAHRRLPLCAIFRRERVRATCTSGVGGSFAFMELFLTWDFSLCRLWRPGLDSAVMARPFSTGRQNTSPRPCNASCFLFEKLEELHLLCGGMLGGENEKKCARSGQIYSALP